MYFIECIEIAFCCIESVLRVYCTRFIFCCIALCCIIFHCNVLYCIALYWSCIIFCWSCIASKLYCVILTTFYWACVVLHCVEVMLNGNQLVFYFIKMIVLALKLNEVHDKFKMHKNWYSTLLNNLLLFMCFHAILFLHNTQLESSTPLNRGLITVCFICWPSLSIWMWNIVRSYCD